MARKREREQTVRNALTRLLVDHSPPPRNRTRAKRQKVDRNAGSSSQTLTQDAPTKSINKAITSIPEGHDGQTKVDGNTVETHMAMAAKPPVKNKVEVFDCLTWSCNAHNTIDTE